MTPKRAPRKVKPVNLREELKAAVEEFDSLPGWAQRALTPQPDKPRRR